MIDQLTLQTIGIVIAAISVVIGVVNSILVSRRDERRQNLLLKNQELSLETRRIGLYMEFTKIIQQSTGDYTDILYNQEWKTSKTTCESMAHRQILKHSINS